MSETPRTDTLERELAAMTARAELAERQVAVLVKHASNHSSCFGCTARDTHRACQHSGESCFERFAAWSRAEAEKGGKG
jgi:hypothetical protein